MDKLVRIKSIDNFRFFKKYRWNNSLKPFGRYNIIYGWNGCGKSTLCDFFASIEKGDPLLLNQSRFQLCFQEDGQPESIITNNSILSIAKRIKVYHQQYAYGLVSNPDKISHITIIGHDETKLFAQNEEDRKEKNKKTDELAKLIEKQKTTTQEFENYRRERATLIREIAQYNQGYNYKKIYERYREIKFLVELPEREYRTLSVAVRATQKHQIQKLMGVLLTQDICADVRGILLESPVYSAIEELQHNVTLRNWIQQGFNLHETTNPKICQFCHNPVSSDRWHSLESYFNESLTHFKKNIAMLIKRIEEYKDNFINLKANLPHTTQFFDEFTNDYQDLQQKALLLCDVYILFLTNTIGLLKLKDERIIDTQCASDFELEVTDIHFDYSIFDAIASLIEQHNAKVKAYQKSIDSDKEKLEIHIIAKSKDSFLKYDIQLDSLSSEIDKLQKEIIQLSEKIQEIDIKIRNSRIPADIINQDIKCIFSHSELHFEWKENGYEIRRNDDLATNLSTGEQNAIALIYFFNSLYDNSVSIENCTVILDDPVSSFDSNYYYSAAAYIRTKLENVNQALIFTHKFSLYKDFSRMFYKCHRYLLDRECSEPVIKQEDLFLRDYEDEYVYLFSKVYNFAKQPPKDINEYFLYPNIGRRLLESFIAFKMPSKSDDLDILAKAIEMDKATDSTRIRALTRLVQNHSHSRRIGAHDSIDNVLDIKQLPDIFRHLLAFIEKHDSIQYQTLAKQMEPDSLESRTLKKIQTKIIKLYDLPVSAGYGMHLDDYEPFKEYETTNLNSDFAVRISGDSMEPKILNGDIVLVKKQEVIDNTQIGIFVVDGEIFCKNIEYSNGETVMISNNSSKYPPKKILEEQHFRVLGKVIEVITKNEL